MAAMAMALAVATGRKLWGQFEVRQGKVLHLDWEQNELTVRRYQRMARVMGIRLEDLDDLLGASMIPTRGLDETHRLNETGFGWAERALTYLCEGKSLCIIDSFRQAFEMTDENSSSAVAIALKMLARVSYATGCVILLIAHSRKVSDDTSLRNSLRGSGAVYDQADTVYMLRGEKGKPTHVECIKERHTGKDVPTFGLRVVDVQGPNMGDDPYVTDTIDPEYGLDVEYVSQPEMQAECASRDQVDNVISINVDRIETIGKRIGALLAGAPDGLTLSTLEGLMHSLATSKQIGSALPVLIQSGAITVEGRGPSAIYRSTE